MATLGRNTGVVFTANAISGLLNLGALIWFARVLGSDAMGSYAQVVVAVDLIAGLFGFGFNQALIRTPSDHALRAAALVATTIQAISIGVVMAVVLLVFWVGGQPSATIVAIGALTVVARCVSLFTFVVDADYRARLEYGPIANCQVVAVLVSTTVGVACLYAGADVLSLAIREVCGSLLVFGYFLLKYEHRWRLQSTPAAYASLWSFTRSLWALNALERLALRLDYLLVGYVLGREPLGVYFAVRGLLEGCLGFVLNPIQTVLYSFYCRLGDARRLLSSLNRYALLFSAPAILAVGLTYLHPPVAAVSAVLGEDYAMGALMLPGLLTYAAALIWFENTKVAAMSFSVHGRIVLARVCQIVVLLVITLPLARLWDLLGATLATGVGAMTLATVASVTLARVLHAPLEGVRGA